MPNGSDKKIELSWQQIVWGISLISIILLTYADIKNKVLTLSAHIDNMYTKAEEDKIIIQLQQTDREIKNELRVINKKLNIEPGD